jgi:hypothetical protein
LPTVRTLAVPEEEEVCNGGRALPWLADGDIAPTAFTSCIDAAIAAAIARSSFLRCSRVSFSTRFAAFLALSIAACARLFASTAGRSNGDTVTISDFHAAAIFSSSCGNCNRALVSVKEVGVTPRLSRYKQRYSSCMSFLNDAEEIGIVLS